MTDQVRHDEGSGMAADLAAKPKVGRGDLTQGPIGKTLLAFALPTLASSILQSLNGTINAIWVGRFLGEARLPRPPTPTW